jgi:hypothetical protein
MLQILILIAESIHLLIINLGVPIYLLWKGRKLLGQNFAKLIRDLP